MISQYNYRTFVISHSWTRLLDRIYRISTKGTVVPVYSWVKSECTERGKSESIRGMERFIGWATGKTKRKGRARRSLFQVNYVMYWLVHKDHDNDMKKIKKRPTRSNYSPVLHEQLVKVQNLLFELFKNSTIMHYSM